MKSKYEILKENIGISVHFTNMDGYLSLVVNHEDGHENGIIKNVTNELLLLEGKNSHEIYSEIFIDINHIHTIYFPSKAM